MTKKYLIIKTWFGNIDIQSYDNRKEWIEEIDQEAITDSDNRTEFFEIAIYDTKNSKESIKEELVDISNLQDTKRKLASQQKIPEDWKQLFYKKVEYVFYYEDNEKYYSNTECYDSYEELYDMEYPTQYIDFEEVSE